MFWHEFQNLVKENGQKENVFLISRDGAQLTLKATPNETGQIGLLPYSTSIRKEYTLGESITGGVGYGMDVLKDYVTQFKYVFTKKGASQVGGFGAIGGLFPDTWDWTKFLANNSAYIYYFSLYEYLTDPGARRWACDVFII